VKHLILDEADCLLGKGFEKIKFLTFSRFEEEVIEDIIKPLKNKMKVRNENIQFIFCLATFDKSIQKYIKEEFNNVIQLSSNNLHKTIKNVKHKFIEMKGKDKLEELESILKGDISVRILKFKKKRERWFFVIQFHVVGQLNIS
jgi:superfamily II DNA/RNA helicase